jgi:hypothetical protein
MSKDTPDLYWALAYVRLHQYEDVRTQALALCDEIAERVTEARMSARTQAFEEAAKACDQIAYHAHEELAISCAERIRVLADAKEGIS